jgi:hypothetical protein
MVHARAEEHYADQVGKGAYRGCQAYSDFRDLVTRDDIDAVVSELWLWESD